MSRQIRMQHQSVDRQIKRKIQNSIDIDIDIDIMFINSVYLDVNNNEYVIVYNIEDETSVKVLVAYLINVGDFWQSDAKKGYPLSEMETRNKMSVFQDTKRYIKLV